MKKFYFLFLAAFLLVFQSCFFFTNATAPDEKPETAEKSQTTEKPETAKKGLSVGDKVNGKTIIWENTGSQNWVFLAIGNPSVPMQWANSDSKFLAVSEMKTGVGSGKNNTTYLIGEFNSQAHTSYNNAAKYCRSKQGWLPSRAEATKAEGFVNLNFWTSNAEATSRAFYYDPVSQGVTTIFRTERKKVVTVPFYYLDRSGNIVNP